MDIRNSEDGLLWQEYPEHCTPRVVEGAVSNRQGSLSRALKVITCAYIISFLSE